jgi:hypothetical protein
MRTASLIAVCLFLVAAALVVYSMAITPQMDSGVEQQGYRRPIQDMATPKEKDENAPLQEIERPASG